VLKIGIVSDTHGLLRPEAEQELAGVAHIIHAGDIGRPDVLVRLRRIAPVTAIRGNIDTGDWAKLYPDETGRAFEQCPLGIFQTGLNRKPGEKPGRIAARACAL
jgi:predicted phosphodiesterase